MERGREKNGETTTGRVIDRWVEGKKREVLGETEKKGLKEDWRTRDVKPYARAIDSSRRSERELEKRGGGGKALREGGVTGGGKNREENSVCGELSDWGKGLRKRREVKGERGISAMPVR